MMKVAKRRTLVVCYRIRGTGSLYAKDDCTEADINMAAVD
jgi:hypothetical protein